MKKILLSLLLTTSSVWANFKCDKTVDPKRMVVFVDTNRSKLEVDDAQRAACIRRESFKRLPSTSGRIDPVLLKKEIENIAKSKIAITSMVVSGHNGGGNVHGLDGGVTKEDVIRAMKDAYQTEPKLLSEFKSVFMWGCWSMGPAEVDAWRKALPDLKMASGFINMGPLNTTEASHSVLRDLLVKEKAIVNATNKKDLKRMLANIENFNETLGAVYTKTSCGENYYYKTNGENHETEEITPDDKNYTPGTHFVDYDKSFNCETAMPQVEKNRKLLMKYWTGKIPLPPNTPNSPVTQIYDFIRSHANCVKKNHVLNGDRVGMLRFYQEIKQNFAMVFDPQIMKSEKEFKHLDKFTANYDAKGAAMKEFEKYFQDGKGKFFVPNAENLKTKSRKEIIDMISYLDGMVKLPISREKSFKSNLTNLKSLRNAMEIYLYEMNPKCMDFLNWHEHNTSRSPQPYCDV